MTTTSDESSSMPPWLRSLLPWVVVAVLVWGLGHLVSGNGSHPLQGTEAPAVHVDLVDGTPFSLEEQSGVTVVNFWASWCGPCRAEAPALAHVHQQLGESGRVLGLAVDANSVPHAPNLGMHYPIALAPRELQQAFNIELLPSTFVVRDGQIIASFVGPVTESDLHAVID